MRVLLYVAVVFFAAQSLWADDRLAPPTPAQLQEAEKLVKDVYKDEFAKRGIDERRALAEKLLEEGKSNKSDAASQYVLLCQARDAAVAVADVETAMAAVHELGEAFTIDAVEMKTATLQSMRLSVHTVDGQQAAAESALTLVSEAMLAENFDAAVKAADLAVVFATGAKNMGMATEAQARKNDIKAQSTAYLAMKIAEEKLKKNPTDAASAYALGSYLALYKNDWDKGLNLLAQGNDTAFAEAAKADVASPVSITEMTRVADLWFDLAGAHPPIKVRVLNRAEFWYNLVGENADGLIKQKIEKRLEQIAAAKEGSVAVASTVSEATRKVIPTSSELKRLKEAAIQARNNPTFQNDYNNQMQLLQNRLQVCFQQNMQVNYQPNAKNTLKDGDFFALCKAESDLRKIGMQNGNNYYGNNFNFISSFDAFAQQSKNKDEFAGRLLAYEKFNSSEKVLDAANVDSVVYSTIRNYVGRNQAMFPTGAARVAFCVFLKNRGVKSAGVERYKTFSARFR